MKIIHVTRELIRRFGTFVSDQPFERRRDGRFVIHRARFFDGVAFTFRMGAGFAGNVTRTHPAGIEPCLVDTAATNVLSFFGQAVVADQASPNGVRAPQSGDTAALIYGVAVRPYPFQPVATTADFGQTAFGAAAPAKPQPIDVLKSGYILVTLQGAAAATKGVLPRVTTVAGTGYLVGGWSVDAVAGTQVQITDGKSYFNGPADATGIVELGFNL